MSIQDEKPVSANSTTLAQNGKPTLHSLFMNAAKIFPDSVAIIYDDGQTKKHVPYDMLLNQASQMALFIKDHSCSHQVIGLVLQTGSQVTVALLGVLLSESAFIIIDLDVPVTRLHYLIKQLHIGLLITHCNVIQDIKKKLESFYPEVDRVGGEDLQLSSLYLKQVDHVTVQSSLAYVMCTSGTTGTPKLVNVPHRCIVPNILHLRQQFQVRPADVVFQASPLTFDPSIVEMFIAMTTGATLLLVPDSVKLNPAKMMDILVQNKTTIIQATPTLMLSIGSAQLRCSLLTAQSALRVLALGGEVCPPFPVLHGWCGIGNTTRFYNLYGITEVSCWATCYSLTDADLRSDRVDVPLGEVLEGTLLEIRSQSGEETEHGVLWIGGSDRVCCVDGDEGEMGTVYRNSGDEVGRDASGQIIYLGRQDEQIKRHGKRVNLVELEQIASRCDAVRQAAAIYDSVTKRLGLVVSGDLHVTGSCYLGDTASGSCHRCEQPDISKRHAAVRAEIEQLIADILPAYCVPDVIIVRQTLPMTRHGKVDKKQLMLMDEFKIVDQCQSYWTHSDAVMFIWKDCLHLSHDDYRANLTANFLELGGSSLSALCFVSRVGAVFPGLGLPVLLDVTLHQTLADVLVCLEKTLALRSRANTALEERDDRIDDCDDGITPGDTGWCPHSLGGEKGDVSEELSHSLVEYSVQTVSLSDGSGHQSTEVYGQKQQQQRSNDSNKTCNYKTRKRKLSNKELCSRHKEHCLKQGITDDNQTNVDENHENVTTETKVFVCSVERGNRTHTDILSLANCATIVLTREHVSVDKPVVTRENISVDRSIVPKEHISVNITRASEEHISVNNVSIPKEHISVGTISVSGEHISANTCGIQEEIAGPTDSMAAYSPAVRRHAGESPQPSQAENTSDLGHLVVTETWQHDTGKCVDASPLVATYGDGSRFVFIGSHSHSFVALELESGHVIWRVQLGDRIEGSACLSKCGRLVIVGSYDGCLYILEALTGKTFWQFQTGADVKSSPCVDPTSGHVFFGSHDHCLYALDILKKTMMWRLELDGSLFSSPSLCLQPHCVYAATLGGSLSAVSPDSGTVLWRCMLGKPLFSSPVTFQLGVIIGCVDSTIYGVSHLGQKLWQHQTEAPIFSSPCISSSRSMHSRTNELVVFGSHDSHIYCIDCQGGLHWKVKVDSAVYSTPFVFPVHASKYAHHQRDITDLTKRITQQMECYHRQQDFSCIPIPGNRDTNNSKPVQSGRLAGSENIQQNRLKKETVDDQENCVCVDLVAVCSTKGKLYILTMASGRMLTSHQFPGETFSSPVVLATDAGFDVVVGCRDNYVYCLKFCGQSELRQT